MDEVLFAELFKALPRVQPLHRIVKPARSADIDAAASRTNSDPTDNQKKAGNYKMGHFRWHGLSITIETARGQKRRGRDSTGKPWETTMAGHYGFIRGAVGKDRDPLDVFVGVHPESEMVFVVDQRSCRDGAFDEHKVVIGTRSAHEAKALYDASYSSGWRGFMAITPMTVGQFKGWMKQASLKLPASSYATFQPGARLVKKSLEMPELPSVAHLV